ncbi:MAG: DUF4386 domain-containing protein [Caldilineaceae bacterium]
MIANHVMTKQPAGKMAVRTTASSPQRYARIAGWLYLSMIPLGIMGIMYVPLNLVVAGDAAATVQKIVNAEGLFRLSIVSALVVQLVNLILVLVLYRLLKPASQSWAALMVIFFAVAIPIAMLNELNNFAVLALAHGADYLHIFSTAEQQTLALFFLELHEKGVLIAGIFWGLWLFPMGYLVFKSGFLPRILGILLMIGCFGYLVDSFAAFLFPAAGITIAQFTFIGEVTLPLWLVTRGVDVAQWQKRALASAQPTAG